MKLQIQHSVQEPRKTAVIPSRFYVAGSVHWRAKRQELFTGECVIDKDVFEMTDPAPRGLRRDPAWQPSFSDKVLPRWLRTEPSEAAKPIDASLESLLRRFAR